MIGTRSSRNRYAPWVVGLTVPLLLIAPASAEIVSTTPAPGSGFTDGVCPSGAGWTKAEAGNDGSSLSTGAFGSIRSIGSTVTYNLTSGYVMDICVKAGDNSSGGGHVIYRVKGTGTLSAPALKTVSHLSFRRVLDGDPDPDAPNGELTVTKTAVATLDRHHSWTLAKTVTPTSLTGVPGQTLSADYTIVADKTTTDSNHSAVTGTITVQNTSSNTDVTVTVEDSIAGAVVDCNSATGEAENTGILVAKNDSVTCSYTAPGGASVTSNTATAKPTAAVPAEHLSHFGPASHTATVRYTANETGADSGTLTDPMFEDVNESIDGGVTRERTKPFTCSSDPNDYTGGAYTEETTNTATLASSTTAPLAGQATELTDSATVTLTCNLAKLEVAKTAAGTFDRTYSWGIDKSALPASHTGFAGDTFDQGWGLRVERSESDADHTVSGTVTISNTAPIAQTFVVSDVIDGTHDVLLDCPSTTVAAASGTQAGTVVCSYSHPIKDAKNNVVTVTAPGNSPVSATADIAYTPTILGDRNVTLTDDRFSSYTRNVTDDFRDTLREQLACPSEASAYANGPVRRTIVNTANIRGAATNGSASAQTVLTCRAWLDETATGKGIKWTHSTNWFMFTPVADLAKGKVDLIAGQTLDAGDITLSGNQLTIALHSGYRFDPDLLNNVKVHPLSSCKADQPYVDPGKYSIKTTVGSASSVTLTVPTSKVCAYAIHVDTERLVS